VIVVELTSEDLHFISIFSKITKCTPTNIFKTDFGLVFLVNPFDLGKAIGKNARNISVLKKKFGINVLVLPDVNDPEAFVRHTLSNVKVISAEIREAPGQKVLFLTIDERDKGIALGKKGRRIKMIKQILKEKYGVDLFMRSKRAIF
jgi:N utilization substance protein A